MDVGQPDFGRRLKELRVKRGLSQAELAHGPVSSSYISRLEGGLRLPSPETVRHLAERLGIDEGELLSGELATDWDAILAEATAALTDRDLGTVVELLGPTAPKRPGEPSESWTWQALWALAQAQAGLGDLPGRLGTLHALLALARRSTVGFPLARLLIEVAGAERSAAQLNEARLTASEAVGLLAEQERPQSSLLARATVLLLSIETECGLLAQAGSRIPELLELTEQLPAHQQTEVLWSCSTVRVRQGLADEGLALITRALAQADSRSDLLVWSRLRLAAVSLQLRSSGAMTEESRCWLAEATDALRYVGAPSHLAELQAVLARVHLLDGRPADARAAALEAERSGLLAFQDDLRTKLLRARATAESTDAEEGFALMREVAAEAERVGYLDLAAEAWKDFANLLGEMHKNSAGNAAQ
jgi:transcriptional regulator with XRE-family HTH domain